MVEIVSHCWNYTRLLVYQLSSLALYEPYTPTMLTVFAAESDDDTVMAVETFRAEGVNARLWLQPRDELVNRSIGRNMAAKATRADVVWFADCDLVFGDGAIDSLYMDEAWSGEEKLFRPNHVLNHNSREIGDEYIDRVGSLCSYDVEDRDFTRIRIRKASGAYQIVSGDVARKYGYVPDIRTHQQPYRQPNFRRTFSDVGYRKQLNRAGVLRGTVDIPNVYRIRHTISGSATERGVKH